MTAPGVPAEIAMALGRYPPAVQERLRQVRELGQLTRGQPGIGLQGLEQQSVGFIEVVLHDFV